MLYGYLSYPLSYLSFLKPLIIRDGLSYWKKADYFAAFGHCSTFAASIKKMNTR